ncbi:MAG: nuclease-related domain-containing protein [Methanospirillum sp.]
MTGLRYFFGERPRFRHEFEQLQELGDVVKGADLPGPIYLASNFLLANGEIDCLLLMPRGMVLLDLKAYQGEVHGAEEGEWWVDGPDGEMVPLKTNLFHQLRTHRFDLANRLLRIRETAFPQIEEKDLMKVGAWGYFKRGSTYSGGEIDRDRVKWFDIVTADTIAERLMLVDAGFTIGEKEMDAIVGALHLTPSDGFVSSANGSEQNLPAPETGTPPAATSLETALVDRMDAIVARMEAIPGAIAGLVRPAETCEAPPPAAVSPGMEIPGGCSDAIGPDESDAPPAERIRRFVCERYAAPARREGRAEFELTSGEVHREMGLSNQMPAVCGALRSRRLEEECDLELVEEVRSVRMRENSATNRFVYRVR